MAKKKAEKVEAEDFSTVDGVHKAVNNALAPAVGKGKKPGAVTTNPPANPPLTNKKKGDILPDMTDTTEATQTKPDVGNIIPQADNYLDANFNVLLIGAHGTGKTQSILDLCEQRGLKFKYFSCSTLDPYTDLVGVPMPKMYCEKDNEYFDNTKVDCPRCKGKLVEALKMVRPREVDEAEFIFFDEFNRADPKTLNAIFEIIQFKSINGEPLKNLKACWAAMNPPNGDYAVDDVDPALLDRFHIYVKVEPKPSISYMSQFVPFEVAKALNMWWNDHGKKQVKGDKQNRMDYISPRRLMTIGLVWMATQNATAVKATLPPDGQFDTGKLIELLRSALKKKDQKMTGVGIGDAAADFEYDPPGILAEKRSIIEFLDANPQALETHQKVADGLKVGAGGTALAEIYGDVLNALNPAILEAFLADLPKVKVSQIRMGFKRVATGRKSKAQKMQNLHKALCTDAAPDFKTLI